MAEADGPTVLIVEDEALVLEVARAEFEDAGFEVLAAGTADDALALLRSERRIDLLFTDIRMPGGTDGWALAEEARVLMPRLPVIYATGFSGQPRQPVEGALLFQKPYRLGDVLAGARALL